MTRCQLMRGTFDHPEIPAAPQHIAACEVQPEGEKDAGVEFISLKITKQRPSGGLVCSPFIASKNMFKVISLKDLHNCTRNYSRGRKRRNHQTICFCNSGYAT